MCVSGGNHVFRDIESHFNGRRGGHYRVAAHLVHGPYDPCGADHPVQRQRRVPVHVPGGHPAGCHPGRGGAVLAQAVVPLIFSSPFKILFSKSGVILI